MPQRNIVITGGFGVLGQAVAEHFRDLGDRLALLDAAPGVPESLPGRFPEHLLLAGIDLTDTPATVAAFERVVNEFEGIDCLINIAGGFAWETIQDGSAETWDRMYSLNLRTAVTACKAALPGLLAAPAGRIVNIGAAASHRAALGMGAYAASKAGVARLTEALAEELKDRGVTVNAVLPSIIDTPANRRDMPDADFERWVSPGKLAGVIAFLCSDAASVITGAAIPVTHRS